MGLFDAIFGSGGMLSEQHLTMRSMRTALAAFVRETFAEFDALAGSETATQVVEVCQYPERECETFYVLGASGNVMRVRVDGAPQDKAAEFMAGEPAVEFHSVTVPNDAADLLKGDQKL
jgi:hypothetical protein